MGKFKKDIDFTGRKENNLKYGVTALIFYNSKNKSKDQNPL
jgi:hypothetical protein